MSDNQKYEVILHAYRRCDAKDSTTIDGRCENIVTHWVQEKGYAGPVYCMRHASLAKARGIK